MSATVVPRVLALIIALTLAIGLLWIAVKIPLSASAPVGGVFFVLGLFRSTQVRRDTARVWGMATTTRIRLVSVFWLWLGERSIVTLHAMIAGALIAAGLFAILRGLIP
jgi:hypothetical protein